MSENDDKYLREAHAMQAGVAILLERKAKYGTPKDLRVGVNSAFATAEGLATLLMDKGVFTMEEYLKYQADAMERERQRVQKEVEDILGTNVTLV